MTLQLTITSGIVPQLFIFIIYLILIITKQDSVISFIFYIRKYE